MSSPEWRNPLVPSEDCGSNKPAMRPESPRPPSPRLVNIAGTGNHPLGYRIRGRRCPSRTAKKSSIFNRKHLVDPREDPQLAADRIDFLNWKKEMLLEKRIFREKINRKVKAAMDAYDEDLARRRDLLHEQQLREHIELTRRLVEEARREEEKRLEELAAEAARAELEREKERQELVRQKMLQRHFVNSQELREQRWRARTEDRKRVNLVQIENNRRRHEQEQKEESDWHALMRRSAEAGMDEERLKEASRVGKLREQAEVQLQQKAEKEHKDSAWKSEWQNPASLDVGEIREPEARKRAQAQRTRENLEKQMAETRRTLEERRRQEEALDKLGTSLQLGSDLSEPEIKADRERRRREIWAYLENLKEVREKVAKRQAEMDECVCELAERMDADKREARRRAKEQETRLNRELVEFWDSQLEHKRERDRLENDPGEPEDEVNYWDLLKAEKLKRRQKARCYGRELLEQHETKQTEQEARERLEEDFLAQEVVEMERQERELAEELSKACLRHKLPATIP